MNTAFNLFFENFSSYIDENFSRPVGQEKEDIRNGPKRIRRLDSLARLIIMEDTDNCAAVGLVKNNWLITANKVENIKANADYIIQCINLIYTEDNGRVRTKDARTALLAYLNAKEDVPNIGKLRKDVRKFLSSLKTNSIFNKTEIQILFKNGFKMVKNDRGLHAEIMLLLRMLNKADGKKIKVDLGISKLCCKLCAAGIFALQNTYQNLQVEFRGRHGNFYFRWKTSQTLFINNFECFKVFVGREAYKIYHKASTQEKENILNALSDLDANREALEDYFKSQRGGVMANSDSSAPPDTDSPQQDPVVDEVYNSQSDAEPDSEDS